jgi:hypothetical protein
MSRDTLVTSVVLVAVLAFLGLGVYAAHVRRANDGASSSSSSVVVHPVRTATASEAAAARAEIAATKAANTFCERWNRQPSAERRSMMAATLLQLDPGRVDLRCLGDELDRWVRWSNRTCGDGAMADDVYAYALVREAQARCP